MGRCFAPDCNHTNKDGCKMYFFPSDDQLRRKWIQLIRRADRTPNKFYLVCSCHFKDGKKENLPTMFKRNISKILSFHSPEKFTRRKRLVSTAVEATSSEEPEGILENPKEKPKEALKEKPSDLPTCNCTILQTENYFLKREVENLQQKLTQCSLSFSFAMIEHDNTLISMYTGLPDKDIFMALFNYLSQIKFDYYEEWDVVNIPLIDQLLLTLMKLKLNLLHRDLAIRFGCSSGTVTNIFLTWLHVMHVALFKKIIANENKTCLPSAFSTFTHCRIVLDCTEIYTHVPQAMDKQKATYSQYKHRTTLKGLIGVAPNGVVTYLSKLYVGSTSDKKIVSHSGLVNQLVEGDLVLAHKGFLISDVLPQGVTLNIPPFLTTGQFTQSEILQTEKIARARVHIERAIGRIKTYKILNLIPANLRPFASMIFQVCGSLSNLHYPLIKEVEDLCISDSD